MKVSVCIITYNHEKFLAQAIEGALIQDVKVDYEIVIGEDCSTDDTANIALDYQKKFPDRIRVYAREHNLGMMRNFIRTIEACRGEYIALCEGDDYWTSPHKLQEQVEFLDNHPDFAICSHNVLLRQEGSADPGIEWLGAKHNEVSTLEDLLRDGSGGATCSLMFRNKVFGEFPDWYYTSPGGDWALQVLCASQGNLYYFREVMGVFRRHDRGALYAQTVEAEARGKETTALACNNSLMICDTLDRHFAHRYSSVLSQQKAYWYWGGALAYALNGNKNKAREYFWSAKPYIWPLPYWLTLISFVRGILILFSPMFLISLFRLSRSFRRLGRLS